MIKVRKVVKIEMDESEVTQLDQWLARLINLIQLGDEIEEEIKEIAQFRTELNKMER